MSGGHFDYIQHRMDDLEYELRDLIVNNGSDKRHPLYGDLMYHNYSDDVIQKFTEALVAIKRARIYTHCIDYLVSGDYGTDTFFEVLEEKLNEIHSDLPRQENSTMEEDERV